MTPPRVAIVGAGLMGRWHARAAARAGSTVVAVADPDATRAAALASRHPAARSTDSLAAALALGRTEIVHLCTPLSSHFPLALEALSAGCHVLVEKPFTESVESTRSVLAAAAAQQRLVAPVHQFPFQHGVRRAMELLPTIGPLRQVSYLACSAGAAGRSPEAADLVAEEILPHPLSLVASFFPGTLAEAAWQVRRPRPGEWQVGTTLAEVGISIVVSMAGRPPVNELRLVGERGSIHVDLFHGHAVVEGGGTSRYRKIVRPIAVGLRQSVGSAANLVRRLRQGEPAYPGLNALVTAFHAAARDGSASPIPANEILAIAVARERIIGR
ncbi:MAG: Gfo/Idh/MocA family oxidoreductase [Gemmatimonadales bacterium]|nr:Gfo/Idh/MocA family oxidoreductase [Gemmatimonadales bacterium]